MSSVFDKKGITIKHIQRSEFADRLRRYRKAAGYSQKEVARLVKWSKSHDKPLTEQSISNYERDISTPDVYVIVQLCQLYGITPNDLLW